MKKYAAIYYLCFWVLIFGAFASMAQYTYGLKICGLACFGFILTFLHELTFRSKSLQEGTMPFRIGYVELISLLAITFIYMLRNFSIEFLLSTPAQFLLLIVLFAIQLYFAIRDIRIAQAQQSKLVNLLLLYYGAIFVFLLSLLSGFVLPFVSALLAAGAILLTLILEIIISRVKKLILNDETISGWQYFGRSGNRSAVLLIAGVLLCSYNLLYYLGVLPPFYLGTLPEGYQRLVEQGVTKNEAERAGEFKARYDDFVERHSE